MNKVVSDHKPLEPVDDNSDLGDAEEATGLICWILFDILLIFSFYFIVFEIRLLMYLELPIKRLQVLS